jgi:acyl-homoserine-lactone acylase
MRLLAPVLLLAACPPPATNVGDTDTDGAGPDPYDVQVGPYDVDIRWTSYGIPHLVAADDGSIGFGLGYVAAQDHICVIADQIVKTRSERARYFGPGTDNVNVDSDFGWLHLGVRAGAEATFLQMPANGQARLVGYAAGYNQYLSEVGSDGLPGPCRGAAWVQPITHIDLLAYYYSMGQWASGYNLVTTVGNAQPPGTGQNGEVVPSVPAPDLSILEPVKDPPIGSNGWAIGKDNSATGGGALLSNTHFPMTGERQWHEFHLTIPGELDVYGVGLVGLPLVAMGFNKDLAWTHTVSNTPRFVPYLLTLQPGNATSYLVDGEVVPMESQTYTIEVQGQGSVSRTLYRTRFGPVWNAPVVGWGIAAMTYRDVNVLNTGLLSTFDGMDRASTLEEFEAAHREHQGIPWVHTMATTRDGRALYMDSAATPNIPPEVWQRYDTFASSNFFASQFANFGLAVFDGSTTSMDWADDPDAARPGTVPHKNVPRVERSDFVANANDNYWLPNPASPITGVGRIYGPPDSARSARTRQNLRYLMGMGESPEIGPDGKWTLDELEAAAMSMRSLGAELLLDGVVGRCTGAPAQTITFDGAPKTVDLAAACATLAAWDGRGTTASEGAHLWREFIGSGPIVPDDLFRAGNLFTTPFSASDPVGTPRDLTPSPETGPDPVLQGLAFAVARLEKAGIELDAPLGDIQRRKKLGTDDTWPVPGGQYFEGYIGIATWSGKSGDTTLLPALTRGTVLNGTTGLTSDGYVVTNGNSFMMAVQFGPDGPQAKAVMVYSQSENPESPHFADQMPVYAEGKMRPVLFDDAAILADPNLVTKTLSLPAQ